MADYIEREALMSIIEEHHYLLKSSYNNVDYGMFTIGIKQAVDECPVADVTPVKHGKWQRDKEGIYQCSECKRLAVPSGYGQHLSKYCPYCGAKMEKGEDNG